jgi:hypothetical protein
MAELAKTQPDTELVIALGREGKVLAKPRDAQRYPHTVEMAAKFETEQGKIDYRIPPRVTILVASIEPRTWGRR